MTNPAVTDSPNEDPPLSTKDAQIHRIRQALLAARHEIAGDPKNRRDKPGVGHDPALHMSPTAADDDEMTFCPVCHVLTNLQWLGGNLREMQTTKSEVGD